MSAGTPARARSLSVTVIRKLALTVLVASSGSVTVHVTVVVPIGKVDPEAGLHVCAGRSPASSSVIAIDPNVTTAPAGLVAATVLSAGGNSCRSASHVELRTPPWRATA